MNSSWKNSFVIITCLLLINLTFSLPNDENEARVFQDNLDARDSLAKGLSEPLPLALGELGGSLPRDQSAIKDDFQPLMNYLGGSVQGQYMGWDGPKNLAKDLSAALHLQLFEKNITQYAVAAVDASWNYNTDMTEANSNASMDASRTFSSVYKSYWDVLFSQYNYASIGNDYIRRQYEMHQSIGTAILNYTDFTQLNEDIFAMMDAYSSKVCPFNNMKCDLNKAGYDIDRLEIEMAKNKDYSKLLYYWEEWRDVSGRKMIDDYESYIELMNVTARMNNFNDAGEMWIEPYTTYDDERPDAYTALDFKRDIESLWQDVRVYYEKLHAYVRYRLQKMESPNYGKYFNDDRLIPAHILGNMWAQSWENVYDFVTPYPEVPLIDISDALEQRNNVTEMFRIAEEFFLSIGMYPMTPDFWENSMLVQPSGKQVVCHASAWDFYSTEDDNQQTGRFRIKMCTNTTQEDFIVVHHEMGHNEYQMAYSNHKPLIFRDGANPGFHEAIGDTIALSVSTPSHLKMIEDHLNKTNTKMAIKLTKVSDKKTNEPTEAEKQNINFLMKQALAKFVFLPYAYILDQWRWEAFAGEFGRNVYNKRWWEKRIDYQGIRPPIARSAKDDFDIGCKYHIPASVPYIRYFVAHILQFQFHEKLCAEAQVGGPLFECDIHGKPEAGTALKTMLEKGASVHWQDQLQDFLGTRDMSTESVIKYFEPLWTFLDAEITSKNITVGWKNSTKVIDDYIKEIETISAVVPIVVGMVLAVLVCIVLIAFFVGQHRRKNQEAKGLNELKERKFTDEGKTNDGMEIEESENKDKDYKLVN